MINDVERVARAICVALEHDEKYWHHYEISARVAIIVYLDLCRSPQQSADTPKA